MKKLKYRVVPAHLFIVVGTVAVICGGVLSAFSAKQPTTLAMWASAYLVLVTGVVQAGFGVMLRVLAVTPHRRLLYAALLLYNLGSAGVMASSAIKYGSLAGDRVTVLSIGSCLLLVSLAILGYAAYSAKNSVVKVVFYVVIATIGVCVPIGALLAKG